MAQPIVPTPAQTLSNILATLQVGLQAAGVSNPQLDQNSDFYITASSLNNQLQVAFNMIVELSNSLMPDSATGSDLDRIANNFGITRKAASGSDGFVLPTISANTYVAAGTQLVSTTGLQYQTVNSQTLIYGANPSSNNQISVESIDVGTQTNLPNATVLNWIGAPGFASSTVVATSAFTGGADAENDDALRTRLLGVLQSPPLYGNWSSIANTAENASPFIEKAYVYPVSNGPSTQSVCFTSAQTPSNMVNRGVRFNTVGWQDGYSAVINSAPAYVATYVPLSVPWTDGYLYSITNYPIALAFKVAIPYPVGSLNTGIGGGWLDFTPFPSPTTVVPANIITSGTSTSFTIQAQASGTSPDPALTASALGGGSSISWISDQTAVGNGWVVQTAQILTSTFTSTGTNIGNYAVTINQPFVDALGNGPQGGDYIFPASTNAQSYLDNLLVSFAGLGPGQINSLQVLFPNSYRQPLINISNPSTIDDRFNASLVRNNTELTESTFFYIQYSLTSNVSNDAFLIPGGAGGIPGTNAPGIWTPVRGQLAWYPA